MAVLNKDAAIITQVAAKIASDLTEKSGTTDAKLGEFAVLFSSMRDILFTEIFGSTDASAPVPQIADVVSIVKNAFPGSTELDSASGFTVTIAGKQHGELPVWLSKDAKKAGVTKVYDNRDGLVINPKRPWFKAVDGEKSFWPPRGQ